MLHERPTPMNNRADERERFANLLSNDLKAIEAQVGADFAQAVFVEILGEHPEYSLEQLLAKVPVYRSSHGETKYQQRRMFLGHAHSGLHNTAVLKLGYPSDQTTTQLIGEALGLVLDDKFHISLLAALPQAE